MADRNRTGLVASEDNIGVISSLRLDGTEKAISAIKALSSYGLITFSRSQNFKTSHYSYYFFKPVAKLKQLYNFGIEVLVLCCSGALKDFLSRAKDFIDFLTQDQYKNRLDKVICILINDDQNAVKIIRNDRKDSGDARIIVPFLYEELILHLSDSFLQDRLRQFLYERDLFDIATPLQDDNLFFGKDRTDLISDIYGKYMQGEHGGLFGLRRIGKTSILNLLRRRIEQSKGAVIYFDCSDYQHLRWNSALRQIIQDIQCKYNSISPDSGSLQLRSDWILPQNASRYTEQKANISFKEDIIAIYHGLDDTRILLIFDEIERISYTTSPEEHWRNGNDALYFWDALRSVSNQSNNQVFSFLIAGVNPKCIEIDKINGTDNPIFNILKPIYVSLFDIRDVKEMVSNIGGYIGLQFEEEIYTKLIDDYGGHPFLTRQVCSIINKEALAQEKLRPYVVPKRNYETHSEDYQAKMESVIVQILGVLEEYYPNEYSLLKILALNGSTTFKKKREFGGNSISHLLGYCLVEKIEDDFYIRINSIKQYLNDKYAMEKEPETPDALMHQVLTRRDNVERKLRSLIRTTLVQKFGGKKAREYLIEWLKRASKDSNQILRVEKSGDLVSATEYLYFSQLKDLVLKDWSDYTKIFNDKNKFQIYYEHLNDCARPIEAHSRSIDVNSEDWVLLNFAFKFFEKAMEDI